MTTSSMRSATSMPRRASLKPSTTKSSQRQPLNHASRPTAATAAAKPCLSASQPTSSNLLKRERFLIQNAQSGQYLSGALNGRLTWSPDPRQGFRYSLMETVLEQLQATREFYKVPDVQVVSVVFTFDPNASDRLDAWDVLSEA